MEQGTFTLIKPARAYFGTSVSDWYNDGRFASHKYFKFIVHNIIMRKRTSEQSKYIMKEQIGNEHMSLHDLKQKIQRGDISIAQKIL